MIRPNGEESHGGLGTRGGIDICPPTYLTTASIAPSLFTC